MRSESFASSIHEEITPDIVKDKYSPAQDLRGEGESRSRWTMLTGVCGVVRDVYAFHHLLGDLEMVAVDETEALRELQQLPLRWGLLLVHSAGDL